MPRFTANENAGLPDIDLEENYDAAIESIEEVEQKEEFAKPGVSRFAIKYRLLHERDAEGEPVRVVQFVNYKADLGPRSTLYQLVNTLLFDGKGIPNKTPIDTDDLIDVPCRIYWGEAPKRDGGTKIGVLKVTARKRRTGRGDEDEAPRRRALEDELADVSR